MPKTLIPPFSAEGSSAPEEKGLHPPALQKILEALAVTFTGLGQGLRGNPLAGAQLGQAFQNQRMQAVQNAILGRIIGQGVQLGQTPETVGADIPSINLGTFGQTLPTQTETNPAYADLIQKILQGTEQFTRLGGDPNQLVGVLGKAGLMKDPILERQLKIQEGDQKFKTGQADADRKLRADALQLRRDALMLEVPVRTAMAAYYSAKTNETKQKTVGTGENKSQAQAQKLLTALANKVSSEMSAWETENQINVFNNRPTTPKPSREQIAKDYFNLSPEQLVKIEQDAYPQIAPSEAKPNQTPTDKFKAAAERLKKAK